MGRIATHPVAGVDYPATLVEFDQWLSSEEACRDFLQRVRWPEGFQCPACGASAAWRTGRGQFRCSVCQRQTSATAGTIFEGTRKPLRTWFKAMWYVTSQKQGVNALGLQRVLGLRSYQTAWTWLHKLRRAMVRLGRERLSGRVEVDETYVGGVERGVRGRETFAKSIVVMAVQADGDGIGRIRMRRVPNVSADSLLPFVHEAVERGSVVHTDGWRGYARLSEQGYTHEVTNLTRSDDPAHVVMPRVHRVASLLKRWILGTHHGSISPQHLDYYLDEFTFRFNRRTSRARGLLFYRLLQQGLEVGPVSYRQMVGGALMRDCDR